MIRKLTISRNKAGFTIIELLVVIGILVILAALAYAAINPIGAQRKARDAQRLKDLAAVQSIVEQFVTDNPSATLNVSSLGGTNACSGGWLSSDMCNYANTLPVDASNKSAAFVNTAGVMTAGNLMYQVIVGAGNYRICSRLESASNATRLTSEGGTSATAFEVFNSTSAGACSI